MVYDINVKLYTCKSCGLTLRYHEILDAQTRNIPDTEDEEKKRRERRECLKWWLSKKEK